MQAMSLPNLSWLEQKNISKIYLFNTFPKKDKNIEANKYQFNVDTLNYIRSLAERKIYKKKTSLPTFTMGNSTALIECIVIGEIGEFMSNVFGCGLSIIQIMENPLS